MGLVGNQLAVDVRYLRRNGLLQHGASCSLSWMSARGESLGSIELRMLPQRAAVAFSYRIQRGGGEWESVLEHADLVTTACFLGGERQWFICPGPDCGRRVAILYVGRALRCRRCNGLTYQSQRDNDMTRLATKAQNIRWRLGGNASLYSVFPPRPKGMHWSTYARLHAEESEANYGSLVAMGAWMERRFPLPGWQRGL
jgi:hypothetical protein